MNANFENNEWKLEASCYTEPPIQQSKMVSSDKQTLCFDKDIYM
jgi:hypothetical protein